MKLLANRSSTAVALCLLGGAADFAPTAFAAPIDTYANFLNSEEIEQFGSVNTDEEGGEDGRSFAAVAFDPAISRRLHDVTGTQLTAEEQSMIQYLRSIPVTKITGTTKVHVDRHHDSGKPVEGKAAFIVLNDNPDAKFVHGSTEIAAKAGTLVSFDANVPHNTQVARGSLSLVGPVDLRRLTPVGNGAKGAKSPKAPKSPKSPKAPKSPSMKSSKATTKPTDGCYPTGRMLDMGDRRLTLQYMTDRFNEDGSVRSFVDSLGYEVDLKSGMGEKENVLAKKDCEGLMSLIDHDSYSNVEEPGFQDIQKYIDESDLVAVIGKVRNPQLRNIYGVPFSTFVCS